VLPGALFDGFDLRDCCGLAECGSIDDDGGQRERGETAGNIGQK
jgi:hypothetical protein